MMVEKIAGQDDQGKRFDVVARKAFNKAPLSQIFKALREGKLLLNGKKSPGSARVKAQDKLSYLGFYPQEEAQPPPKPAALPGWLQPLWENENLAAFNKPAGIKSHDGPDSLASLLRQALPASRSLSFRPSPCHRLDRNTSGLIMCAKTLEGARQFSQKMQSGSLAKSYLALLSGALPQEQTWRDKLARANGKSFAAPHGKNAVTRVKPLAGRHGATLAEIAIETGLTHQIRAQSALHGFPLRGDAKYGARQKGPYLLHAWRLQDQSEPKLFPLLTAPPPAAFNAALKELGLQN